MTVDAAPIPSPAASFLHPNNPHRGVAPAFDMDRRIEIVSQAYPHLPEPVVCGMVERMMQSALGAQLENLERAVCDMEAYAVMQELGGANLRVLQAMVSQLAAQLQDLHRTLDILREKSI